MAEFVDEYLADISGRDIDEILKKLTDDAVFFAHTFPAVQGKAGNMITLYMQDKRMVVILVNVCLFNIFGRKSK